MNEIQTKTTSISLIKGRITASNIFKICKLCLEEKTEVVPITARIEFKESSLEPLNISEIFTKVTSQTPTDALPNLLCFDCLNDLKNAFLLLLRYEQAVAIIEEYMVQSASIKIESTEDDLNIEEIEPVHFTRASKCRKKGKVKVKTEAAPEDSEEAGFTYACPICTKRFSALDLRDHAHTHKALKKYLNIPEEHKVTSTARFSTTRHLSNPGISFFSQDIKLHKCPYCDLKFSVQEFRQHVQAHIKEKQFKCNMCERVFKQLNHLNMHRLKHMKEFPYKCEQCDKGFVIKNNYDCHMLTHTNNELPHECKFCFRRFSNPEHLNRHQIIHTENVTYSVKYKVCRCNHCLKTFKDRTEMKRHNCTPVEQTSRYPCKTCNKVFKHPSGLYNHKKKIHKLKGAKTLCSVCGHYVANIYSHMMRHSGEKPHQCNQCGKRFIAKPQLKQHLLVHSGLKPYVCSVCAKAFNNLYNLQVHERIHKGDRCHICTVCNKGFLEKSYLKKHVLNVHTKV